MILKQGIYHFAANVLVLYSNSKIDMEYFKTLCHTPWSDYEIGNRIDGCIGRLNDRINQYEKMMFRLSMPGVKHIFYGEENFMLRKLYDSINLSEDDYRVMKQAYNQDGDILPCKDLEVLKEESGPIILFVRYESDNFTAIKNIEKLGFENKKDFFVIARFMSFLDGGII